jgi:predicted  nucleic acid-binding Zn-ribbon protein
MSSTEAPAVRTFDFTAAVQRAATYNTAGHTEQDDARRSDAVRDELRSVIAEVDAFSTQAEAFSQKVDATLGAPEADRKEVAGWVQAFESNLQSLVATRDALGEAINTAIGCASGYGSVNVESSGSLCLFKGALLAVGHLVKERERLNPLIRQATEKVEELRQKIAAELNPRSVEDKVL